jgi:hypothetical protein
VCRLATDGPADSGESGGGASGAAPDLIGHGQALSDISVAPAGPTAQVARSVTAKDLPDGTPVAPYGERAVSFKNLPMNARQILQHRTFFQDDETKEWRIGMDLPLPPQSEYRPTTRRSGPGAGVEINGYVIAPPGSPPLPEEGSEQEPASGLRYGKESPYTGLLYFKVFNGDGQAISPVTGRTGIRKSPETHYPVDPVRSSAETKLHELFQSFFGGR